MRSGPASRPKPPGDVENYGHLAGWQAILVPGANQLLFNIPDLEGSVSHQHIRNTITGAWCRFSNMNALHWATFGRRIFFGEAGGIVCEGNVGFMDDQDSIEPSAQQAYSYIKGPGSKQVKMMRPVVESNARVTVRTGLNTDYERVPRTTIETPVPSAAARWNSKPWDTFGWAEGTVVAQRWTTVNKIGTAFAPTIAADVRDTEMHWHSTDLLLQPCERTLMPGMTGKMDGRQRLAGAMMGAAAAWRDGAHGRHAGWALDPRRGGGAAERACPGRHPRAARAGIRAGGRSDGALRSWRVG